MAIQVWLAAIGFRAIARFERWTVPITFVVLIAMTIVAWTSKTDVRLGVRRRRPARQGALELPDHADDGDRHRLGHHLVRLRLGLLPLRLPQVPRRKLYLGSVLGQFLPTVWLGIFGATLATVSTAKSTPASSWWTPSAPWRSRSSCW